MESVGEGKVHRHCVDVGDSAVLVANLRSQSPTINHEKVTNSRQQSNIGNFVQSHGVLPLGV